MLFLRLKSIQFFSKSSYNNLKQVTRLTRFQPHLRRFSTCLPLQKSSNQNKSGNEQPLFFKTHTTPTVNQTSDMMNTYEKRSNETLDSLTEKFEALIDELASSDNCSLIDDETDVSFSNGVLTVKLGRGLGTFVINRQTPNLQIWLSSPFSGPKRFDFDHNTWIYRHTGESLHELLTNEVSKCYKREIDFTKCKHGARSA